MSRLAVFLLLLTAATAQAELPSASAALVTQTLQSGKPAVVDLGARACVPCRKMAPILEGLATEYRGRAGVLFIDVSSDNAAADRFRVRMIPTQIFFNAQGKEVNRHVGFMDKAALVKELQSAGVR